MPALDGIRILDMTQWEAGTSCTQALAWLGADVVKVEPPGRGDPGRGFMGGEHDSEYFLNWNANKRSLVLDLLQPEGRELLLRLVPHYDVFIENYGPGVIEKLELGYEVMRERHPGLIYARVKGFGTWGPYADYKCMDMVAQAASGAMSVTGNEDEPPQRPGPTMGDSGTGVQAALAILAAWVQRERTGLGQLVEISMQEAMTYYMRTMVANGSNFGTEVSPRKGHGFGATMNLYACRPGGPNDYIYVMVVNTRMWQRLASAIGRDDLIDDARFASGRGRHKNADALYAEIAKWTAERSKQEAMARIAGAGVPCSAVLDTRDLFSDPHLQARDFVKTVEHRSRGPVRLLGNPLRLSASEVPLRGAPLLGEHTREVLGADLALSSADLAGLAERGVIGG